MTPIDPELDALRRKIGKIEADLGSAKESLGRLESAEKSSAAEPPLLVEPTSAVRPAPEPNPARPQATEPSLLSKAPLPEFEPAPRPIRDWLASCHMWPPSDEGDTEVRLAAWWATRLGRCWP